MTFFQDLRYAVRMLVKDTWFTLVAATALGLGIGVNTTVFTFVNAVLIRGLPFPHSEEIVYLATREHDPRTTTTARRRRGGVRGLARQGAFLLPPGGVPAHSSSTSATPITRPSAPAAASVTAKPFGLLGQTPFLGRDFAPGEDAAGAAPVVIIGHSIWKNRYDSDPAVIGRTLKLNEAACTIIGVMPPGMRFPTNADLWRPLTPPAARRASGAQSSTSSAGSRPGCRGTRRRPR